MLKAVKLPARVTELDTALADVDRDDWSTKDPRKMSESGQQVLGACERLRRDVGQRQGAE